MKNVFTLLFGLQNILVVDCYKMDKHLECYKHLVYYQVSGELGIAIYLSALLIDHRFFLCV